VSDSPGVKYLTASRMRKLLPVYGIIIFILLYVFSAYLYPGGSQSDRSSKGFSWLHNYWCNLLSEHSINGMPNNARPFALAGMVVLFLAVFMLMWVFFSSSQLKTWQKNVMKVCSFLCMVIMIFLSTSYHDSAVNFASVFGAVVLLGLLIALFRNRWRTLFISGIFCFILMILNNLIYRSHNLEYLPVIQMITLICFLMWIASINLKIAWKEDVTQADQPY
jgi:uncharacterized ion transporter superfamily protein YfcC